MTSTPLRLAAALSVLLVGGCTMLPEGGPSASAIQDPQANQKVALPYELIDVTRDTIGILLHHDPSTMSAAFGQLARASSQDIGVGDLVEVAIFEAGPGLFSTTDASGGGGSKMVRLPPQFVDRSGMISVPYAGRVVAAGRTSYQVQRTIEERLKDKAIEPQVIVAISKSISSVVTVTGAVKAPAQVPMPLGGMRLLDALSQAGGAASEPHEVYIRLTRGKRTAIVPLQSIVDHPSENVPVAANDTIMVTREPRAYIALGATGVNALVPFETYKTTAAEAIAKAGGLLDIRANPAGVFVYRFEDRATVADMRPQSQLLGQPVVPVIYRIDLRSPDGFFLAQSFDLKDRDLIYIANADAVQTSKALSVFNQFTATASGVASTYYLGARAVHGN